MDVRNCRMCGSLYNYIGGPYRGLCPRCVQNMEDKFAKVKEYIEENPGATMTMISEECDVGTKQIEQWIREERLTFSEESPIGIACEVCGRSIKTGRFCDKCKESMANKLGSMYGSAVGIGNPDEERAKRQKARMRFLDK